MDNCGVIVFFITRNGKFIIRNHRKGGDGSVKMVMRCCLYRLQDFSNL